MSYQDYRCNNYAAVDGRVYCIEPKLATPVVSIHPNVIAHLKKEEQMSMIEIYSIESFLRDGHRAGRIKSVPRKERDRIVSEYGLTYDASSHRLNGSYEYVWKVLQEKFPEATHPYKGYKECQYAVRYGTQPCGWVASK